MLLEGQHFLMNLNMIQIFKFGGASVKDASAVKNVASILKAYAQTPTIVIVSAMGKTTNHLEKLVNAYFYKEGNAAALLEELKQVHLQILKELIPDTSHAVYNDFENVFVEMQWAIEDEPAFGYNQEYDQIVGLGEVLATKIISAYLNTQSISNTWIDARGIIQTDNTYREGKVDYDLSQTLVDTQLLPQFSNTKILITQGFIGGTSENFMTTLGREGSDYTAALLAYFSNAAHVTIWKDVPGVLNADPKYFKNTQKIDELTYQDAIELTYYGASVIHPKTIKPLQNKNIPLYVKSFLKPSESGTVIKDTDKRIGITSYIFKTAQILISIQPKDFSFIAEENLSSIFKQLSRFDVRVNMMQNSAISFSICVDHDEHKIPGLISELQNEYKVLYNAPVELMTIRNYDQNTINKLSENKLVLLEQRSRFTHQMVMKTEI